MTQIESEMTPKHLFAAKLLVAIVAACLCAYLNLLPTYAQESRDDDNAQHVVQAGETLSEIAAQYELSMQDVMSVNGIVDPNTIVVGQTLRLPDNAENQNEPEVTEVAKEDALDTTENKESVAWDDSGGARIASLNSRYTVESGDNIGLISLRMGVDIDALSALNNLPTEGPVGLIAGETLILPAMEEELHVDQPSTTYTVQPGDVLGTIAKAHGLTMADLMKANFISDPNLVTVGEKLIIPAPAEEEVESDVQIGPPQNGFYYYTVQAGNTLSEIAKEFDTTMLALLEFNNLPNEETVYRGLDLSIPYGPPKIPQRLSPAPLSGTSFLVSLSRQECWLFEGRRVKERWICSTGYGDWITRTGAFNVQSKIENAKSSAYELDMPYWLGLYDVGDFENGIHGLPVEWETGEKIWDGLIGQPATFGCAMLDDEDAVVLFDAAYLGMPVYVMQ